MATVIDTIIMSAPEAPASPLALAFGAFAASLPALLSDEADLAGYSGQDPALDSWFRAAERSRGETLSYLNAVVTAKPKSRSERAMRTVAAVFRAVLLSSNPDLVGRLTVLTCRMFAAQNLPGEARRTIGAVLNALTTYVAIETFGNDAEVAVARRNLTRIDVADMAGPLCEDLAADTALPAAA
jgi:hypothetical protein